jgi:glutamyl-tRNA synthetase
LDSLAKERTALGLPAHYDRSCFGISSSKSSERAAKGEKYVVRLKTPKSYPEYFDLVYGRVGRPKAASRIPTVFDDPVLLKSDGSPTYHLANVVDDYNMKITHVIRGVVGGAILK